MKSLKFSGFFLTLVLPDVIKYLIAEKPKDSSSQVMFRVKSQVAKRPKRVRTNLRGTWICCNLRSVVFSVFENESDEEGENIIIRTPGGL